VAAVSLAVDPSWAGLGPFGDPRGLLSRCGRGLLGGGPKLGRAGLKRGGLLLQLYDDSAVDAEDHEYAHGHGD
jgi:hypothetical protein